MIPQYLVFLLFAALANNYVSSLQVEGIVGGLPAEQGTFRYQMTLNIMLNDDLGRSVMECTGAIVHSKFAVTLASCVIAKTRLTQLGMFIRRWYKLARGSLNMGAGDALLVEAKEISVPARYNPETQEADLAVVESMYDLDLSRYRRVQIVDLPNDRTIDENTELAVSSGYGYNEIYADYSGQSDLKLRYVRSNVTTIAECRYLSAYPTNDKLCAKTIPQYTGQQWGLCRYDLGAPLVIGNTLIGLAQKIQNYCVDTVWPATFTRIKPYFRFIQSVILGTPPPGTRYYRGPQTGEDLLLIGEDI